MKTSDYTAGATLHEGFADEANAPLLNGNNPHNQVTKDFAQAWGIHPGMALLTLVVDTMLFGTELGTAGFLYPLSIAVALGLGVVTYVFQKKYYGDDDAGAITKAFIVAGLTAIPTSIPTTLLIPAGIVGLFRKER